MVIILHSSRQMGWRKGPQTPPHPTCTSPKAWRPRTYFYLSQSRIPFSHLSHGISFPFKIGTRITWGYGLMNDQSHSKPLIYNTVLAIISNLNWHQKWQKYQQLKFEIDHRDDELKQVELSPLNWPLQREQWPHTRVGSGSVWRNRTPPTPPLHTRI